MAKMCDSCGKKLGLFGNAKIKDGKICLSCANSIGLTLTGFPANQYDSARKRLTVQEVKDLRSSNQLIAEKVEWNKHLEQESQLKERKKQLKIDNETKRKKQRTEDAANKEKETRIKQQQADAISAKKAKEKQLKKAKKAEKNAKERQQREKLEDEYLQLMNEFKADKAWHVGKVYFDEKKKQVLVKKNIADRMSYDPEPILNFPYSDLENYDIIEDPTTIEKKHGVSRSIVGVLVAGPAGAMLGAFAGNKSYDAVSKVAMILYFKNNYHIEAVFLNENTPTSSSTYAAVQRSVMQVSHDMDKIIAQNNSSTSSQSASNDTPSSADSLRELKQLLDDGIITQDDFDAKKKQILGI